MELIRLNVNNYQPDKIIDGWNSLIWTERYDTPGDFELRTSRIEETLASLKEMSLVSLVDSREVQTVDSIAIEVDSDGHPELILKGTTLFDFFKERATKYDAPQFRTGITAETYPLVIAKILNQSVTSDSHAERIARTRTSVSIPEGAPSGDLNLPPNEFFFPFIEQKDMYTYIQEMLVVKNLGFKAIRPGPTSTEIVFFVYAGIERWRTPYGEVIYRSKLGHVDIPKYLFSLKNFRNVAHVSTPVGFRTVFLPGTPTNVRGFQRKVLPIKADDITKESLKYEVVPPAQGEGPSTGGGGGGDGEITGEEYPLQTTNNFIAVATRHGIRELRKYNRTRLLQGDIMDGTPYTFGVDYNLGDIVKIEGDYKVSAYMRVVENVRSHNSNGETMYPTFATENVTFG